MPKYSAVVRFNVLEFEAADKETADKIVNELIDDFSHVDTAVAWDDVDWITYQEGIV